VTRAFSPRDKYACARRDLRSHTNERIQIDICILKVNVTWVIMNMDDTACPVTTAEGQVPRTHSDKKHTHRTKRFHYPDRTLSFAAASLRYLFDSVPKVN